MGGKVAKKCKLCSTAIYRCQAKSWNYKLANKHTTSVGYSPCCSGEQECACSSQWWLFSDLS